MELKRRNEANELQWHERKRREEMEREMDGTQIGMELQLANTTTETTTTATKDGKMDQWQTVRCLS